MTNKPPLSPDSVIARSEDILFSELEHEIVMMNIENGEYYDLDSVGAAVWDRMQEPTSIAAICAGLMEEFEVEEARCEADVLAFLTELRDLGAASVVSS